MVMQQRQPNPCEKPHHLAVTTFTATLAAPLATAFAPSRRIPLLLVLLLLVPSLNVPFPKKLPASGPMPSPPSRSMTSCALAILRRFLAPRGPCPLAPSLAILRRFLP